MNIGNRIKEYRKKAKMSQKELAQKIGKGYSTVQKYELNLTQPPIDVLNKIAEVLNIGTSMLLDDDDEPKKVYSAADLFSGVGFNPDSSLPVIKEEKDSDLKTVIIEQNGKKHKFEVRSKASNEEIAEKFKLFLQFVEFTDGDDKK